MFSLKQQFPEISHLVQELDEQFMEQH